jgi:hypothetical protein
VVLSEQDIELLQKRGYEVGDKSLDRAGGVVAAIGMVLVAA